MESSVKLGRIFGVEVGVHWSWFFIFVVVTWSFAEGLLDHYYPEWDSGRRWIAGGFIATVFFLSVLAHELAHAVLSNRSGLPVRNLTLFLFGGVSNLTKEPPTASTEFKIAIVGPLTSLALGALFAAGWLALRPANHHVAAVSANLAVINASLAAFNMLPGFPLDGGRVFRAIVWARGRDHLAATRTAAQLGEWIAYAVMGAGVLFAVMGGFVTGIWLLLIGIFLRNSSAASYASEVRQSALAGVPVSAAMRTDIERVPPAMTVDELVRDHILPKGSRCFAVAVGDLLGLVTLTDVQRIPAERRATTSVYRAMTPAEQLITVSPSESLEHAMRLLATRDVNQLPVLRGRDLLGVVSRSDILEFISIREHVGGHPAGGRSSGVGSARQTAGDGADRTASGRPLGP